MAKQMVKLAADMIETKPAKVVVAAPAEAAAEGGAGEPLNFRVTTDFRRRFRQYALDHDMRLSAVLVAAFAELEKGEG